MKPNHRDEKDDLFFINRFELWKNRLTQKRPFLINRREVRI